MLGVVGRGGLDDLQAPADSCDLFAQKRPLAPLRLSGPAVALGFAAEVDAACHLRISGHQLRQGDSSLCQGQKSLDLRYSARGNLEGIAVEVAGVRDDETAFSLLGHSASRGHRLNGVMRRRFQQLYWYHATRALAVVLILWGLMIEDDPGNRSTYVTAAFGLLGAEPVARRDSAAPKRRKRRDRQEDTE